MTDTETGVELGADLEADENGTSSLPAVTGDPSGRLRLGEGVPETGPNGRTSLTMFAVLIPSRDVLLMTFALGVVVAAMIALAVRMMKRGDAPILQSLGDAV